VDRRTNLSMEERLNQFLIVSADWERQTTSVRGIFLLKLPRSKISTRREAIAIEINPINQTTSSPTKKRGIVLRSASELEEINNILTNPKLSELARMIDDVNPAEVKIKEKRTDNSDIIEI
jgi:hypothetical protein